MLHRLLAAGSALLLGACTVLDVRVGTEEPAFESLGTAAGVEIRRYGPRLAAETTVAGEETGARSQGFSRLAAYIFGGNAGSARIAMTAPVAQAGGAEGHLIRFFLPAALRDPPAPNDVRVRIVEVPGETVAVFRFSGGTDPATVAAARARLLAALPATGWAPAGEPVAWFYDPPWTILALRRNEIAVAVAQRG